VFDLGVCSLIVRGRERKGGGSGSFTPFYTKLEKGGEKGERGGQSGETKSMKRHTFTDPSGRGKGEDSVGSTFPEEGKGSSIRRMRFGL